MAREPNPLTALDATIERTKEAQARLETERAALRSRKERPSDRDRPSILADAIAWDAKFNSDDDAMTYEARIAPKPDVDVAVGQRWDTFVTGIVTVTERATMKGQLDQFRVRFDDAGGRQTWYFARSFRSWRLVGEADQQRDVPMAPTPGRRRFREEE